MNLPSSAIVLIGGIGIWGMVGAVALIPIVFRRKFGALKWLLWGSAFAGGIAGTLYALIALSLRNAKDITDFAQYVPYALLFTALYMVIAFGIGLLRLRDMNWWRKQGKQRNER